MAKILLNVKNVNGKNFIECQKCFTFQMDLFRHFKFFHKKRNAFKDGVFSTFSYVIYDVPLLCYHDKFTALPSFHQPYLSVENALTSFLQN